MMVRLAAALLVLVAAGCAASMPAAPGPAGAAEGPHRQQTHMIPLSPEAGDGGTLLLGRVCRPDGDAPARVVVIAHGSPPIASDRPRTQLTPCDSEAVRWFTARGYLVALSLRRGYGGTGGGYLESSADCSIDAYERAARVSAEDVAATAAYALALPYARHDGAVIVGQSAGGWATLGLNAGPHPDVIALVSMAGGRGGRVDNIPNRNCKPENLVAAAARLGRTATTPTLWVFTENDTFFAPRIATGMHQAFTTAGGKAELHALPAFGEDGHRLFFARGGSRIWGPLIERYLQQQGAT